MSPLILLDVWGPTHQLSLTKVLDDEVNIEKDATGYSYERLFERCFVDAGRITKVQIDENWFPSVGTS